MSKIHLKKATIKEIPVLLSIEKKIDGLKTVSAMTTEKDWQDEFGKKDAEIYLIFEDGIIVGDTSYEKRPDGSAYLSGLVIEPKFQGQGIGRKVMEIIMKELKNAKTIKLVTHPENSAAIKLYLSFGFVIKAWKDNYFDDGEPRIELIKEQVGK